MPPQSTGQFLYPPYFLRNELAPGTVGQPMDPDDVSSAMSDRMAQEMHNNAISAGGYATNAQMAQAPWMPANGDLSRSPIMPEIALHRGEPALAGLYGVKRKSK